MKNMYFFFLLLFLIGCNAYEKDSRYYQDSITLVFLEFPRENSIYYFNQNKSIRASSDISYVDDNLIHHRFFFNEKNQNDTIRIVTQRNRVEVTLIYNGIESSNFLFHKGDTVYFTYKHNIPNAKVINRNCLNYDVNYDTKQKEVIAKGGFLAIRKFFRPQIFSGIDHGNLKQLKSLKDSFAFAAKVQSNRELDFIDSLYSSGLISNEIYGYKRRNLLWSVYSIKDIIAKDIDYKLNSFLADSIYFSIYHDSLIYYSYYRSYLLKKVNFHLSNIQLIEESNGYRLDFCAHFDTIFNLNFLSEQERKYLLIEKLGSIFENGNAVEISKYADIFYKITGDSGVLNSLFKIHGIDLSTAEEMQIRDISSNTTNLNSLLSSYKGKVIYIDFWASWCAPCRASIPDANKLQEEYKGKDVVFFYFALNDKESDWKEAINKLGIKSNCENYLVVNPKTSKYIEELEIKSIPRYLIYDKNSNLVHKYAPDPSSKEIRILLNDMLEL